MNDKHTLINGQELGAAKKIIFLFELKHSTGMQTQNVL